MATSVATLQERRPNPNLELMFKRLIALEEGVDEQQITTEYIREQRKTKIYPNILYNIGSSYGGYTSDGLKFITLSDFEKIERLLDSIAARV